MPDFLDFDSLPPKVGETHFTEFPGWVADGTVNTPEKFSTFGHLAALFLLGQEGLQLDQAHDILSGAWDENEHLRAVSEPNREAFFLGVRNKIDAARSPQGGEAS